MEINESELHRQVKSKRLTAKVMFLVTFVKLKFDINEKERFSGEIGIQSITKKYIISLVTNLNEIKLFIVQQDNARPHFHKSFYNKTQVMNLMFFWFLSLQKNSKHLLY